jgi:hypothetical protein
MVSSTSGYIENSHGTPATRLWRGWDVLAISVLSMFIFFVGLIGLVVWLMRDGIEPTALIELPAFAAGSLVLSALSLTAAVGLGLLWRRQDWSALDLGSVSWRWLGIAVLLALAMRLVAFPLAYLLQALGFPMDNPQLAMLQPENASWQVLLVIFLFAGLFVPIAEELFFRGVLYVWLRGRWGVTVGAVVSAVVFGFVHGHPTIGVIAGLLGVILALVYERSRSLTACIVLHAVFNVLGIALIYTI